jgi:endonuclease-3 related protein
MTALPPDIQLFNEYHALLVRLAKEACRKESRCAGCCLNRGKEKRGHIISSFPCARAA